MIPTDARIPRRDIDNLVYAARMAHQILPRKSVLDYLRDEFRADPLTLRQVVFSVVGLGAVLFILWGGIAVGG